MNLLRLNLVLILLLTIQLTKAGNKTYQFAYDANGNRTSVSFSSTCYASRQAQPVDTIPADTIAEAAIRQLQNVPVPTAYPNPAKDYFILSIPQLEAMAQLILYDLNGAVVFRDDQVNTMHSVIRTCNLPAGMYTLVVQYGAKEPFVQKIIKQ